jgi:hypothetical protein
VDDHGQPTATRRPGSYSASDSAGARRGIRTPDRLIKRLVVVSATVVVPRRDQYSDLGGDRKIRRPAQDADIHSDIHSRDLFRDESAWSRIQAQAFGRTCLARPIDESSTVTSNSDAAIDASAARHLGILRDSPESMLQVSLAEFEGTGHGGVYVVHSEPGRGSARPPRQRFDPVAQARSQCMCAEGDQAQGRLPTIDLIDDSPARPPCKPVLAVGLESRGPHAVARTWIGGEVRDHVVAFSQDRRGDGAKRPFDRRGVFKPVLGARELGSLDDLADQRAISALCSAALPTLRRPFGRWSSL